MTENPHRAPAPFDTLLTAATAALENAYAPYSKYPVGAAAYTAEGRLITGCNIENASYGLGMCAENTLIAQLHLTGGGRISSFVCVNAGGQIITPCGRCRQLLHEFAAEDFRILTPTGELTIHGLLPDAFGPADLDRRSPQKEQP